MKIDKIENHFSNQFMDVYKDMKECKHLDYWLGGGRGSTKSSFIGVTIPYEMMVDYELGKFTNGVALRRYSKYLKDSVFQQLLWGINKLGVDDYWKASYSPLKLTYITGQEILFRGTDEPRKIKSIKFRKGYCKYVWYEEADEFEGKEVLRTINISLNRGGDEFLNLYTYNPPKTVANWINLCSQEIKDNSFKHMSDYTKVPKEWLGDTFIEEAEHLKKTNLTAYEHEYLGKVTGTGGEIFPNVCIEEITDKQIEEFQNIKRGLDWGYATDPVHYTVNHYDSRKRILYIFKEIHQNGLSNRNFMNKIREIDFYGTQVVRGIITCDNSEPKSIDEFKDNGFKTLPCTKGQGSVSFGIKWLQDLESIVIDSRRCPNTAREFQKYSLEPDKNGGFKNEYPDKDNHSIDAVRYSREDEVNERRIKWLK